MAQTIFIEHSKALTSFDENQRWLGVFEPGIYRGFDQIAFSGTTATLSHAVTGILKTDITSNNQSNRTAVLLTKQGSIVHEDASVDLTVDYNVGSSEQRIDYVIGRHTYQDSAGGVDMAFSILKGPLNSTAEPTISDDLNDILIGKIYIPAGAANHDNSTYIREERPGVGGQEIETQIASPNGSIIANLVSAIWNLQVDIPKVTLGSSDNWNSITTNGLHAIRQTSTIAANTPAAASPMLGVLFVYRGEDDADDIYQIFVRDGTGNFFTRSSNNGGTNWTAWIVSPTRAEIDFQIGRIDEAFNEIKASGATAINGRLSTQHARRQSIQESELPTALQGNSYAAVWNDIRIPQFSHYIQIDPESAATAFDFIARISNDGTWNFWPGYEVVIEFTDETGAGKLGIVGAKEANASFTGGSNSESFETTYGEPNILIPYNNGAGGQAPDFSAIGGYFNNGGSQTYKTVDANAAVYKGAIGILKCVRTTPDLIWVLQMFSQHTPVG